MSFRVTPKPTAGGTGTGGASRADQLSFSPNGTGLAATQVQAAIEEAIQRLSQADADAISTARAGMVPQTDIPTLDRGHGIAGAEETMLRTAVSGNFNLTSGLVVFHYFTPRVSRTINTIECATAGTGTTAVTLAKLGLYSVAANGDLARLGMTANDTTLFSTANTLYARALTAGVPVTKSMRYAYATLQVSGGTPKVFGHVSVGSLLSRSPAIAMALTAQTDLPATVAATALTTNTGLAWVAGY